MERSTVGSNPTLSAKRFPLHADGDLFFVVLQLIVSSCFDKSFDFRYHFLGRARRGAGGALYPQSAIAGSNSPFEGWRA